MPVGGVDGIGPIVYGGDCCLKLVGAERAVGKCCFDQCYPFAYQVTIPEGTVLFGQRDKFPVRSEPCGASGVGEEHQGKESGEFVVAGS